MPLGRSMALAGLAALVCGCESEHTIRPGSQIGYTCDAATTMPATDEATPYGFSLNEVLPWISGRHDGTLAWYSGRDVAPSLSGTTTIHIDVVPHADQSTLTTGCGTYLYLPADVSVVTDDGGLDEHRRALFSVNSRDVVSDMFLLLDEESFAPQGSLRISYTGSQVWDTESLIMTTTFTPSGTRGQIEYARLRNDPSKPWTQTLSLTVASWIPRAATDAAAD